MIEGVLQEVFKDFYSLTLSVPVFAPMHKPPHIYFALDISGSMSGEKIELAKESALQLLESLTKEGISMTLIAFDDKVRIEDTRKIGVEGMQNYIKALGPAGGTRFINVFKALKDEITKNEDSSSGILFLTDGCDNDGIQILEPCMKGFQDWIMEKSLLTAIHAIGLGADHDANLLTNLIRFGTHEGTFQFVADNEEIVSAVERLHKLLAVKGAWGYIYAGSQKYKVSLPMNEKESEMEGTVFLKTEDLKGEIKADLMMEGEKRSYIIKTVPNKDKITPKLFNAFAREQLRGILDLLKASGIKEEHKKDIIGLIGAINSKAKDMIADIKKTDEAVQKALLPYCTSIMMLSTELTAVLMSNLKGVLGNVAVARMYDLVFQGLLGGRIRRKFAKLLVKGEAFKKANELIDQFGATSLNDAETVLVPAKFEMRCGPKYANPELEASMNIFMRGQYLDELYNNFGKPVGLSLETPFAVVALKKSQPKSCLAIFEKALNAAWDMGNVLNPDLEVINNMIERKFGESSERVFCVITNSASIKDDVTALIEKLKLQAVFGILNQHMKVYLNSLHGLKTISTSDKPLYQLLMDGIAFGGSSNVLHKLSEIYLKVYTHLMPHLGQAFQIFNMLPNMKSMNGELVFEFDEVTRKLVDAQAKLTPFGMPVKDVKMNFLPMLEAMTEQSETMKEAYQGVKEYIDGVEIGFYGANLAGGLINIHLPGLKELLSMKPN